MLQRFIDRFWYPPLLGLLAALDAFVLVIPNDGILISSAVIIPRRWFALAFCMAIGSTVGALVLASLVEYHGLPWILEMYPGVNETEAWLWTLKYFEKYGLVFIFLVAMSPLAQQPAVILAGLAGTPLLNLCLLMLLGRMVKFTSVAYVAARAPSWAKWKR